MRGKPNTDQFKSHDLHQFLESGAADRAESPVPTQVVKVTSTIEATKPEPTVQKLFRLRWDTANALKIGAAQQSAAEGRRVTETEIIENLLRLHYNI